MLSSALREHTGASLVAQTVKNLPETWETQVLSGSPDQISPGEDLLEIPEDWQAIVHGATKELDRTEKLTLSLTSTFHSLVRRIKNIKRLFPRTVVIEMGDMLRELWGHRKHGT